MTITAAHIQPIVALIAGLVILIMPRFLNLIVAIYLIVTGLAGLGVFVDRDAASIIADRHRASVLRQRHENPARVTIHHFVNTVVDDLPEQVMQALFVDPADVHAGATSNSLKALEYGNRVGVI